jgi:hypothetical protein
MSYAKPYRIPILLTVIALFSGFLLSSVAGAQAAVQLEPVALCLLDRGPNAYPRYEAHFGHRNNTEQAFNVPPGVTEFGINELVGGTAVPALTTEFLPGPNYSGDWPDSAFYVEFDGVVTTSVSWTLGTIDDLNGVPVTATVDLFNTPLCSYEIIIEKFWRLEDLSVTNVPPLDLPLEWKIIVTSYDVNGQVYGTGECIYWRDNDGTFIDPFETIQVRCLMANPSSNITDRLLVPSGGVYSVVEPEIPGWANVIVGGIGDNFQTPPNNFCDANWYSDPSVCRHAVTNAPGSNPTPTPTETPTVEPTPSETPTIEPTPTETPTVEPTPSETPTIEPTPTETPTVEPTPTETPTVEPTPTETPTVEPTPTETPTVEPTPTEQLGCQRNNPERLDCSSLEVTAVCDGTTAVFTITNTGESGNGDMRAPTQYRIIVDGVVVQTGTVQLAGGASMTVTYSGSGRVTLEADQQIGHPGRSQPQATVNCG